MQPVVLVENVSFEYGGRPVLDGIGFRVDAGDFVAVVGSNGAGKSTLLKLLLGELAPKSGRIALMGQDIVHYHDWPKIGYVPQNGLAKAGDFPATALEVVMANLYAQVGFLRRPGKKHRAKALEALEAVGLRDCAGRLIGQLSGGQQQRVLIARVLANDPAVMLLDEPTTGVDGASADQMYSLLRGFNKEKGLTVVLVTHDIARARGLVNRVLCLEHGSVVELDRGQLDDELRHRHTHPAKEDHGNV